MSTTFDRNDRRYYYLGHHIMKTLTVLASCQAGYTVAALFIALANWSAGDGRTTGVECFWHAAVLAAVIGALSAVKTERIWYIWPYIVAMATILILESIGLGETISALDLFNCRKFYRNKIVVIHGNTIVQQQFSSCNTHVLIVLITIVKCVLWTIMLQTGCKFYSYLRAMKKAAEATESGAETGTKTVMTETVADPPAYIEKEIPLV